MMERPLITFSATSPSDRDQGLALAQYIEMLLLSANVGWSGGEIRESPRGSIDARDMLAATAACGAVPCPVISLDVGAAGTMAYARQHLLLRDTVGELQAALLLREADPDLVLAYLRVLRQAERLVSFSTPAADRLRQLGCPIGAVVPMPALPPLPKVAVFAPRTVLVANHLAFAEEAQPMLELLRRAVGDAALVGVAEAPAPGLDTVFPWHSGQPRNALVHVHLGLPAQDGEGARLVDSFACRRPVLLHLPGGLGGVTLPIIHEIEGLVTTDGVSLLEGMLTLLEDATFNGILVRNAEQRLHAFNQGCAAALRAAVPELFGHPKA